MSSGSPGQLIIPQQKAIHGYLSNCRTHTISLFLWPFCNGWKAIHSFTKHNMPPKKKQAVEVCTAQLEQGMVDFNQFVVGELTDKNKGMRKDSNMVDGKQLRTSSFNS